MEDDIFKIFKNLKGILLSSSERVRSRNLVMAHMHEHRAPAARRGAYARWISTFPISYRMRLRYVQVLAMMLLVVIAGAGTANAAQNALPGDLLYAVKIHVNEPIASALASTPSQRAALNVQIANTRLAEAERLAAQGRLTPELSASLDAQIASAASRVDAIAQSNDSDPAIAASLAASQAQLEVSLSAHAQVLTALTAAVPQSKADITPILSSVESTVKKTSVARAQATGKYAAADIAAVLKEVPSSMLSVSAPAVSIRADHASSTDKLNVWQPAMTATSTSDATSSDSLNATVAPSTDTGTTTDSSN